MMTRRDDSEEALDALVRAAAALDADEAATRRAVLGRIAGQEDERLGWLFPDPRWAGAGFAALMLAAGLGGYALPELVGGMETMHLIELAAGNWPATGLEGALTWGGRG